MTRIHRVHVAEGKQSIILVDHAGIRSAGNDAAEHTIHTTSLAHHPRPGISTSGLRIFNVHQPVVATDLADYHETEPRRL